MNKSIQEWTRMNKNEQKWTRINRNRTENTRTNKNCSNIAVSEKISPGLSILISEKTLRQSRSSSSITVYCTCYSYSLVEFKRTPVNPRVSPRENRVSVTSGDLTVVVLSLYSGQTGFCPAIPRWPLQRFDRTLAVQRGAHPPLPAHTTPAAAATVCCPVVRWQTGLCPGSAHCGKKCQNCVQKVWRVFPIESTIFL